MDISDKHVALKEVNMKVIITKNSEITEVSVEIHCREIDAGITKLNNYISNYDERIRANCEDGTGYIGLNEVLYFESVDNRTFLYTADRVLTTEMKLYELEERLSGNDFFRCSKSVIVNVGKIINLRPDLTRNIMATLVNGEVVVISRRYAAEFKKMIGEA